MKTTFLSIGVIAMITGAAWADSTDTLDAKCTAGQVVEITAQAVVVQDGKNTQSIPRADVNWDRVRRRCAAVAASAGRGRTCRC